MNCSNLLLYASAPYLCKAEWNFFRTNCEAHFITSDRPVFSPATGVGIFPISKNILLMLCYKKLFEGNYWPLKKNEVLNFNKLIAKNSSRFIFCPENPINLGILT